MMARVNIWTLSVLILLFSCRKEELKEGMQEEPEIFVDFEVEGNPTTLTAGLDGYYDELSIIGPADSIDVYQFASSLENLDNKNGSERLEIRLRNVQTGAIAGGDLDALLENMALEYYSLLPEAHYMIRFEEKNSQAPSQVLWDLGDGNTSNSSFFWHYYPVADLDQYRVRLSSDCDDGFIESDIFMPSSNCTIDIERIALDSAENIFLYRALVNNARNVQFEWTFSSGVKAFSSEVKVDYPNNYSAVEKVTLNTSGPSYCQSVISRNFGYNTTQCFSNFEYEFEQIVDRIDYDGLERVEVIYYNDQGIAFSSFLGRQQPGSYFRINLTEDYINFEENGPSKLVELNFQCTVYNASGDSLQLNNGQGKLAFLNNQ